MIPSRALLVCFLAVSLGALSVIAIPPSTKPVDGLRDNTPAAHALVGARVVVAPGKEIANATLVIREGVIHAVGADVKPPSDARVWNMTGKTIYAGLIDAFSETKYAMDTKQGAPYWNPRVTPQLRAGLHYQADQELNKKLRAAGITARLVAPSAGIIKGSSAVVNTGEQAGSQAIIRDDVAQHIRLTISRGSSREQFPNSPMGAVALARQTMLDADWYQKVWKVFRTGTPLPRPERNDALAALSKWRINEQLVIIDTANELFALRADRFAREFSLPIALRGSGHEYKRLDAIGKAGRTIIVPLDFPKPPNVATGEAALNVTLEEMMHWDIAPENPARLEAAGVRIALTSHGLSDVSKLHAAVRTAIERGLPSQAALRALTTTPAQLLGVDDRLGTLETGKAANLVVTNGDLFAKETKVLATWVDGTRFEVAKPDPVDLSGVWTLRLIGKRDAPRELTIRLSGTPAKPTGVVVPVKKKKEETDLKLEHLSISGTSFSASFQGKKLGQEGVVRVSAVVTLQTEKEPSLQGHLLWPDETRSSFTAERTTADKPEKKTAKKVTEEKDKKKKEETPTKTADKKASYEVNYPLGAFGRAAEPAQPAAILFKNVTVWTCAEAGILENVSVLVQQGKIAAVGPDLKAPHGATIVDGRGMHLTPGIIDCHSHMATDGGINESSQAITAEVRIGDFVDADDVAIYRQLAGGVTCANILHGSANPIGGQNQVIKLRWGAVPEAMKFAKAPQGIKFALGENVKQSNWGDKFTTRYPQTRMGVEQIMRDAFSAARDYQRQWTTWKKTRQGLPPRRDLELDALSEILRRKRWIHCHSYRQDEILTLIRVLDDFGVTIGTFQHILEGYKVADAMAKHGAMGSAFADWWAYKFEVYDAIPFNGALMHQQGVVVSFNSDDREMARRLNQEAAKAVKYGGVPPEEALKFVTLNPARQLRIEKLVGSIEPGKQADLALWSGPPLSNLSRCEQTWVDGRKYFDRTEDIRRREKTREQRATLVQKILTSGQTMKKPDEQSKEDKELWPRHNEFCRHGEHAR